MYIAATQNQEAAVTDYLERELKAQTLSLKQLQQQFRQDTPENFPHLTVTQHDLSSYDQLIESKFHEHNPQSNFPNNSPQSSPVPNSLPQATQTDSYARSLGIIGTPS